MNFKQFEENLFHGLWFVDKNLAKIYNKHMENMILERETETLENQIGFDFLDEKIESETLVKKDAIEWDASKTLVLILDDKMTNSNFYLCGKKMIDWVRLATSGCEQKIVPFEGDEDILSLAKPYAEKEECDYVAVFYSDTPLLQKATFLEIMNKFCANGMNFMKLSRGYVFQSEFLKNSKMLLSANTEEFGENDFFVVDDAQKISLAFKVLNGRILSYHKENGVVLFGEDTIFIDADVEIEGGTVIYPNNTIKGQSYIGNGVILESGNYIIDSIVLDGAFVCQSYIENAKVGQEKTVGPFARIIKGTV